MSLKVQVNAMGQTATIKVHESQHFALEAPHAYIGGSMRMDRGEKPQQTTATLEDGQIVASVVAAGVTRSLKVPRPDYTLADGLAHMLWVKQPREKGEKLTGRAFDLMTFQPSIQTLEVVSVKEERVGRVVGEAGAPLAAPEPASEPVEVEVAQGTSSPFLEQAEAILAAGEACDLSDDSDHDEYQEAALFFYENARELLDAMRERDEAVRKFERLDWLRMHPESCQAVKDCRNKRAEGYIHCESCLKDGNAGGYFDVYRRYYVQVYNDAFEEILGRIAKQLGELSPPEEAGLPQAPESPPRPR